ncbi:MAG: efflux RND transporter permease subunit, partial [Proteobacteria bacterium]
MFSLPSISIKNPVFAWMLMSGLIIFGGICFTRMGISQLPDVDFPVITVNTSLEGAAPEVMENTIVDVLEGQLTSVEGLKSMTSTSKTGTATIALEFDINRNIDLALQDVQAKVAQAARKLPKDMDPASISKTNPEDQPIVWIAATSDKMSRRELSVYVRDQIRDQFTTLPGVGEITLGGYVDPSMRIWVEPKKLSNYQLTVSDILSTIATEHSELPAGKLSEGDTEWNLRALGEAKTPEDFGAISINSRGGAPNFGKLQLKQVAEIEAGLNDIRRNSRVDGTQAIGLGIRKQRGSNAVSVADGVLKKLEEVRKTLPDTVKLHIVVDNVAFVREAVHELNFALIIAAILTSLLCWLFLGSIASTFNILMSIPTSIVGSFIILNFSNFTLNTFTLLGLSLAIGIVVDDAIMVLENIIRHREMGKDAKTAALDGANEIMTAAIAATFSIAAIFLPVAFMTGIVGKFFYQFGVTMTAAVLLSLVEAITLTPMRAAALGGNPTAEFGFMMRFMHWLTDRYRRGLD